METRRRPSESPDVARSALVIAPWEVFVSLTVVVNAPEEIRIACFEIAHALLDGRDPELEVEALAITQQNYGSVQTSYSRAGSPLEHVANGVPSVMAWRLLRPFLRSSDEITLSRVS